MDWSWNFVTDRSVHGRVDGQTKEPVMEARTDTAVQLLLPLMEARSDADVEL